MHIGSRPQINLRRYEIESGSGYRGKNQIDRRTSQGNPNVSFPYLRFRVWRLLRFIQQCDTADGQQNDRFGLDSLAFRNDRVSQFVQDYTSEDYADQSKASTRIHGVRGSRLSEDHKNKQKNET